MREIVLPWPSAALSPNARGHWTARRRAAEAGRTLGLLAAREAGWMPGMAPDGRIHLWIDFYPPTKRLPDDDNMLARCKAYRDGIAQAMGVDDRRFVSHPYVQDEPRKGGEVRIKVTGGPDATIL